MTKVVSMSDTAQPPTTPLHQVEQLKAGLTAFATGGSFPGENEGYMDLRRLLRSEPNVYEQLPDCIRSSSNLSEFWAFIKQKCATYQERRNLLREAFAPVIEYLEANEPDS